MPFLLYFGRKKAVETGHLGQAGYICRMRKKLLDFDGGCCKYRRPRSSTIQYGLDRAVPIQG